MPTKLDSLNDPKLRFSPDKPWGLHEPEVMAEYEQEQALRRETASFVTRTVLFNDVTRVQNKLNDVLEMVARHYWDGRDDTGFEREMRQMLQAVLEFETAKNAEML